MIKTFVLHQEAQTNILKVTCVTLQQKSDLENNIVWRSSLYRGLGNITKYKKKPSSASQLVTPSFLLHSIGDPLEVTLILADGIN